MIPKGCGLIDKWKLKTILDGACVHYFTPYETCNRCPYWVMQHVYKRLGLSYGMKFVYKGKEFEVQV